MDILSESFVFVALQAEKEGNKFPINFEDVWERLGYSRKDNALRKLKSVLFEGQEYSSDVRRNAQRGNPSHLLLLTIDGFKHFCLAAETAVGREVREYFISVEKTYRSNLNIQFSAPAAKSSTDPIAFVFSARWLQKVSKIKSYSYLAGVIRKEFQQSIDWQMEEKELMMTTNTFNMLAWSLRSKEGTDWEQFPEYLHVRIADLKRIRDKKKAVKKNRRLPQIAEGQLALDLKY